MINYKDDTHSYAIAYIWSTAKLYIGELRGRNISTYMIYKIWADFRIKRLYVTYE